MWDSVVASAVNCIPSFPLQAGSIYMTNIGDFDNPIMGALVRRMWWKPWRFTVTPIYYESRGAQGYISETRYGEPIRNLTKLGVVGMMKLYGVKHQDFQGETK